MRKPTQETATRARGVLRLIVLGILFGLVLIGLSHAEDLPACCGRHDSVGWANNIPPQDAVRFGQQSLGESQSHLSKVPLSPQESGGGVPSFNLLNLEDGGYNPETGSHVPRSTATPDWYKSDKEWASHNLKKYWNLR